MKANLQQALTGKSLRNDIFNTFSNRSLQSFSPFLRSSRQRDSRYLPYSSQHTIMRSQMDSPPIRTDLSSNRCSPSPPSRFHRDQVANSSLQTNRHLQIQRIKHRKGNSSKSKNRNQNKSTIINKSAHKTRPPPTRPKQPKGKKEHSPSGSKSKPRTDSRGRSGSSMGSKSSKSKGSSKNKSKEHGDSKLNLSSIMEQHSEQRIITPSSREGTHRHKSKKPSYHGDKTHKKSKLQELSDIVCRRIDKLCREPSKYLRLMKNDLLSIRYKVERRRIIELEITVYKEVAQLLVVLEKGNLECQHIEEKYFKLTPNSKVTLFSCVRKLSLEEPFKLPSIHVELTLEDGTLVEKYSTLPYTWLHFSAECQHHRPQKSRIITKTCLQSIQVNPQQLRSLGLILPSWSSRYNRSESRFQSQFCVGESEFCLLIREWRGTWSIQLSGRGEQRLHGLISFLCEFLC